MYTYAHCYWLTLCCKFLSKIHDIWEEIIYETIKIVIATGICKDFCHLAGQLERTWGSQAVMNQTYKSNAFPSIEMGFNAIPVYAVEFMQMA